jgi:hypothetical protein
MTPEEWLAYAEAMSQRNSGLFFSVRRFIEQTLGPERNRREPTCDLGILPDRLMSRFFDISCVYRPADRAAFGRVDYS